MNADGRRPRMDQPVVLLEKAFGTLLESHSDGDSFALALLQHPGRTKAAGLGGLLHALRGHAGYADRHGWGATLTHELDTHPRYAAAHHLTTFLATPTPTTPATHSASGPAPTAATPPVASSPAAVVQDPLSVAVGGTLDVNLPNLGLGGLGLAYTITPQPLPANMTFNRGTGEFVFSPAPGQVGSYEFSVAVSGIGGSGKINMPVTVTNPALASTEVSGQVVDGNGSPLAGMPVSIGGATAITNPAGDFTLTGVATNPGPISVGGSVGSAQGRQDLLAPVAQLLGHDVYAGADNAIPAPLILPKIDWSAPASFSQTSPTTPLDITNPAMPGFDIQVPPGSDASGTLQVATLSPALSVQHMPAGISTGMILYKIVGSGLNVPVQLTLPNLGGYAPGSTLGLVTLNPLTGGHDVTGQLVVSADGKTLTSSGPIPLGDGQNKTTTASSDSGGGGTSTTACLINTPTPDLLLPITMCHGCQRTGSFATARLEPGGFRGLLEEALR